MPDLSLERRALDLGCGPVAGVDEVGRGPLAGPVVAAAVILPESGPPDGIDDSKRLSPARRAALADALALAARIGIGAASVAEIDGLNIRQAALLAMRRAVTALPVRPGHLLIDGRDVPEGLPCPAEAVVGGDRLSLSIAAASIVAKVHRDRLMVDLAQQHPRYGWERNKGYGTQEHLLGLKRHGPTLHHRRSFRPVHNILYQEKYRTR